LQVVRVVVPLLENLKENRLRVGRRLKASIEKHKEAQSEVCC